MAATIRRVFWTAAAALVGWCVGYVVGMLGTVLPRAADYPFLAERVPLPHHVPKYPGGLTFRFAMANDVLHERFAKHGPAHYRERDRITRDALAKLGADDPAAFPLEDDLATGLERLGKSDEAAEVMRGKLARQEARGLKGRDLYTSYANLGTFLIHASAPKAFAGDPDARARFREGVGFVRKSVEVNPEAHFGRESSQSAVAEFLLAAIDNPSLLKTFDCVGNRLDLGIEGTLNREGTWVETGYGRPYDAAFSQGEVTVEVSRFFRPIVALDDPLAWGELSPVRKHITKVGAESGWESVPVPSHRGPVAFDEPMLGMIGMWRQGGGANPHFALAMGETMLRVGQRYIAWSAFERASRLAGRYSAGPENQQFLRDHCRKRQAEIEQTLLYRDPEPNPRRPPWQYVSPPPPPDTVASLRAAFDAELALGESYQRDYQNYEAREIAAGVPIGVEHFFDDFYAGRTPIASPVGPEEWFVWVSKPRMDAYARTWCLPWALFGAGVAATSTALLFSWRARWAAAREKRSREPQDFLVGPGAGSPGDQDFG